MKTNNRLAEGFNPAITESSRKVLLVMNIAQTSSEEDLAFAQRMATGSLTDADKEKIAEEEKRKNGGQPPAGGAADPNLNPAGSGEETDEEKQKRELKEQEEKDKELADKKKAFEDTLTANQWKIDDKGNLVDKDNKVLKTKEELEKDDEQEDLSKLPLVEELIVRSGEEFVDDKGQPIKYEDSAEGILKFATDLAERKTDKELTSFFEQNPEIKSFADFILSGGKKEDYFKAVEKVGNLEIEDEGGKKEAILRHFKVKGFTDKEANDYLKLIVDSNQLDVKSKEALEQLKKHDEKIETAEKQRLLKEKKENHERIVNHWTNIKGIVDKGNLVSYIIPESDRANFFNFISQRVDSSGKTQMDLLRSKLPLERLLELDYLIYKGFDTSKLIKQAVDKEKVASIRERIRKQENKNAGSGSNEKQEMRGQVNLDNIDIDKVITFANTKKT